MGRLFSSLAVVAALVAGPAVADAEAGLFPREVLTAGGGARFAERLREPPLWGEAAGGRTADRIRLFIGGRTLQSWSIRLDWSDAGRWAGVYRKHDGRRLLPAEHFRVADADVIELDRLIAEAGLWEIHPQFWESTAPDTVCIDGMIVIFERRDAAGYHYSEGNAQCTLAPAQRAVAAKLMRMAGHGGLEALLR